MDKRETEIGTLAKNLLSLYFRQMGAEELAEHLINLGYTRQPEPSEKSVEAVAKLLAWQDVRGRSDYQGKTKEQVWAKALDEEIEDEYLQNAREISKLSEAELTLIEKIKTQSINAKRNASEIYKTHRALKPWDKQSKNYHDGYDAAMQDLIDYLVCLAHDQQTIKEG